MLLAVLLGLLVAGKVLELAIGKGSGRARLERASEEKLGREQRRELHVEAGTRGGQVSQVVVDRLLLNVDILGVDGRNVATAGVPVSEARNVGSKGAVGEASVAVGGFRGMAKATWATAWACLADGAWVVLLHPEEMRWDKIVPTDVR